MEPLEGDVTGVGSGDTRPVFGDLTGRFWASSPESDDDAGSATTSPVGSRYLVSPAGSSRSASRESKRMEKRKKQQQAAMAWVAAYSSAVSPNLGISTSVKGFSGSLSSSHRLPILEPSVFVLEEFNVVEWITVQRKNRSKEKMRRSEIPGPRRRRSSAFDHGRGNTQGGGGMQGGGADGAGSGAHPTGSGQFNSGGFPRQNNFERGSGSGYGNDNDNGRGGQGYGQYNQNFPSTNSRNFGSSSGYDNGQFRGGGNRWQQNDGWNGGNDFESAQFSGVFGDFDQGFYEGGQGFGQQYGGYGGAQRNRRPPPRNFGQGNCGRGGRNSHGRVNGRGFGGRVPPADAQGHEVLNNVANGKPNNSATPSITHQDATMVAKSGLPQGQQVSVEALTAVVSAAVQSVSTDLSKTAKKKDKSDVLCFRCDDTGHHAVDCSATLCLCCDSAKHTTGDCHLHLMPKPVATMYGLYRDELLFFDIPKSVGVKSRRHSGKVGRIRVIGGSLTAQQIVKELNFLILGKNQWDITKSADNVFKVVYPTKADYARVRKINDIKVDDTDCTIFFEEWSSHELKSWKMREVWVRIRGCPKELRDDYLALFAVGTLIGKTKEVDMAFTREHEVVRMRVLVLNPDYIPETTDHYFDDEGFEIHFEVEGRAPQVPGDLEMREADMDADEHGNEGNTGADQVADRIGNEHTLDASKQAPSANNNMGAHKKANKDLVLDSPHFGTPSWDSDMTKVSTVRQSNSAPPAHGGVIREIAVSSEVQVNSVCVPKKLSWGDRVENDEQDMPSPLARVENLSSLNEVLGSDKEFIVETHSATSSPVTVGNQLLPMFCAAADTEVLVESIEQSQISGSLMTPSKNTTMSVHCHNAVV
ncbi:hypothetical protein ACQ4PT_038690 [Festuca glaucescens]